MFGSTEASSSVSEEDPSSVLDSSEDDSLPLFQAVELDHLLWEWPWTTSDVASQVWNTLSRKATVTEHYDLFLSHAWETNSLLKIAALAIRYNTERADDPHEKATCIQAIPDYLARSKRFVS
ncbi:hypothetical protein FOZ63_003118, partial [Perkinsus olseni]